MRWKTIVIFLGALVFFLVAASTRFYDSAHSMGLIKADGGRARHPIVLDQGLDRYTLIATATVIPPYRGDVRIAVEGMPEMEVEIVNNVPALDLSPHRQPQLRDDVLVNVKPRDRIALWVVLKRKGPGVASAGQTISEKQAREASPECCPVVETSPSPTGEVSTQPEPSAQMLAFYDLSSGKQVLSMPIRFRTERGAGHGETH
ncbi:hypothetical protein MJO47_14705 [Desulfuromonas sp. KJ2020]|uniref:hypothetical protein n=1 Tax=Desulfuromonas sp. KJ2020 TaxID=2919173 RepID=UPI0020A7068F|nr:hypothetical protein [Desulfuromonas sp. KJ2020]MCP3178353.1 hypothetical protein [Desulfuromonas sp. KJ2020]